MRISWNRASGWMAASAVLLAMYFAPAASAQFVPYNGNQNQAYSQYQAHSATQPQPQPQYTAMAFQAGNDGLNLPSEPIGPGQVQNSAPMAHSAPVDVPMQNYTAPVESYSAAPEADCNCQTQTSPIVDYTQATPAASFQSYPAAGCATGGCATGGCANGSCFPYNTFDTGCGIGDYSCYSTACGKGGCGVGGCCAGGCGAGGCGVGACGTNCCRTNAGCHWFGGLYALFMERAGNPWRPLAFSTLDTAPVGYYPTDTEYVMNLTNLDQDTFGGAELRFGMAFGGGGSCGCGPRWGVEAVYWALDDESAVATATDTTTDGNRLYGMIDYRGLEYDPGTGYRPVNHYYDFAPPSSDYTNGGALDELQIRSITARSTFSMQNIEANLLRLPVAGAGCGCDARYSVTGFAGFRYVRMDDDLMYRVDGENVDTPGTYYMSHNVDVDSHLAGAQVGANCCYNFGSCGRWGVHCNTAVGLFNNHSEVWNRMDSPTGNVRYVNNGSPNFNLRYEDDNVAVLGELRAGVSYQYSCNWRFFGGYRLLGISGVALAYEQLAQPAYISAAQTSYVDGDGSIFFHGLQTGIECTY